MSGDKKGLNGSAGADDVTMNSSNGSKKNGKGKDGDEEMTVVVPPSKNGIAEESEAKEGEKAEEQVPIDPKEKAVQGAQHSNPVFDSANSNRNQGQFRPARACSLPV